MIAAIALLALAPLPPRVSGNGSDQRATGNADETARAQLVKAPGRD